MYNQIIIDRINNLSNLYALKNANAKAISKKNEFGDIVKFFARINVNNVIEKMSFKATGCTSFIAVCSYFCEIAEGKTLDDALKINDKQLSKFAVLDESRIHVYKIIIDTFALLVKKYRLALSKGSVVPVPATITIDLNSDEDKEKLTKNNINKAKKVTKSNKNTGISDELKDILITKNEKTTRLKKEDKLSENINTLKKDILQTKEAQSKIDTESNNEIKNNTKNAEEIKNITTKIEKINNDKTNREKIKSVTIEVSKKSKEENKQTENSKKVTNSVETKEIEENKSDKKSNNDNKLSHLNALNSKIKNKENNEKQVNNSKALSDMLTKIKKTDNKEEKVTKNDPEVIKEETPKKKSLFSWFFKK